MIMSKIRNLSRYWIDIGSQTFIRQWTDEEYASVDPHTHIFEKYWYYYCPRCRRIVPLPCCSKEEAKHGGNNHKHYTGHICLTRRKNFELVCLEFKEEYSKEFDVWIPTQIIY
jgi:hypothetical protein